MIKKGIYFVIYLLSFSCFFGQNVWCDDSGDFNGFSEKRIMMTGSDYTDYIFYKNCIWAITQSGKLAIWDIKNDRLKTENYNLQNLSSIDVSDNGEIFLGSLKGEIYLYDSENITFKMIKSLSSEIFSVKKNREGQVYAIKKDGICNIDDGKVYYFPQSLNSQVNIYDNQIGKKATEKKPSTIFFDSNDNIWIGYNYGEWGGSIYVFSTKQNKYKKIIFDIPDTINRELNFPIINFLPIHSIFESEDNVMLATSGLIHFNHSGTILKFVEKDSLYVCSILLSTMLQPEPEMKEEMIGPGAYNKYNKEIYFYSINGFRCFNTINIDSIKTFLKPVIDWGKCTESSCFIPAVKRFEFANKNLLLFLTKNDGIGLFDGSKVKYYK